MLIAIKYGAAMVTLPLVNATLRNDVRRNYRDWRRTHDRYDARAHATLTALAALEGTAETVPYGEHFQAPYATTKAIAEKGLVGALQDIREYSDKTGIPLQALLGRVEAVKFALATTGPNFAGFNAELAKMGRDITRAIADQVAFPGEVKVTLIRETRHIAVAR